MQSRRNDVNPPRRAWWLQYARYGTVYAATGHFPTLHALSYVVPNALGGQFTPRTRWL